jgi:hypothetical protein
LCLSDYYRRQEIIYHAQFNMSTHISIHHKSVRIRYVTDSH